MLLKAQISPQIFPNINLVCPLGGEDASFGLSRYCNSVVGGHSKGAIIGLL